MSVCRRGHQQPGPVADIAKHVLEIEQLAVEKPESIIKIYVEPAVGM